MKKRGEVKQDLSITDHLFEQNRKFIIAVSKKKIVKQLKLRKV